MFLNIVFNEKLGNIAAILMDPDIHFPIYVLCIYCIANSEQNRKTFVFNESIYKTASVGSVISIASKERYISLSCRKPRSAKSCSNRYELKN